MSINEPFVPVGHELLNDDASGPSGATDRAVERAKKFDDEGGDQPQAPSQAAVDRELQQVQSQHSGSSHQTQVSSPRSTADEGPTRSGTGQQPPSTVVNEDQADDDASIDREFFRYQQKF